MEFLKGFSPLNKSRNNQLQTATDLDEAQTSSEPSQRPPINKSTARANSLNSHFSHERGCHYMAELLLKSSLLIFQPLYNIEGTVRWGEDM